MIDFRRCRKPSCKIHIKNRKLKIKKREKSKKVINSEYNKNRSEAIELLEILLKDAPENGEKFQLVRIEYYHDTFGVNKSRDVFYENPDCLTVNFKFGKASFRIVNSKNAIQKIIKAIKKPIRK